jgi:hypothetical protein
VLDEDPFKNAIVAPPSAKRPNDKVATVNFNDKDLDVGLDEDMADEAEEFEEANESVAQLPAVPPRTSIARTKSSNVATGQRKFLEEFDDPAADSGLTEPPTPPTQKPDVPAPTARTSLKSTPSAAKTVAGQPVIDRRQSVQQTVDDWRREMEQDEAAETSPPPAASAPRDSIRSQPSAPSKGHLSPASTDEFAPPAKSQGAVFEGGLIIETSSLPSRFQRGPTSAPTTNGTTGRAKANTGAAIEIAPDSNQNRPRPAGQISLQSLSDAEPSSGVTTAEFQEAPPPDALGRLPTLSSETEVSAGPKLASMQLDTGIAPVPPELPELAPPMAVTELPSPSRGWKRLALVVSGLLSAIGIGLALRRRSVPAAVPAQASNRTATVDQPGQWPRG